MNQSASKFDGTVSSLGMIKLGKTELDSYSKNYFRILFICQIDAFDFLGQLKIGAENYFLEVFNESYFSRFQESKMEVINRFSAVLFKKLLTSGKYSSQIRLWASNHKKSLEKISSSDCFKTGSELFEDINLQSILDRLNFEYFNGKIQADIKWGNRYKKGKHRSFRFGSYDLKNKQIRINPVLTKDFVPRSVLELTIFHEMCHQFIPPVRRKGKWWYHHPEFKQKEREYIHYEEARNWERLHWTQLLNSLETQAFTLS